MVAGIVVCCIGLLTLLGWRLYQRVDLALGHRRQTDRRFRDVRYHLQAQEKRLDSQQNAIQALQGEVSELGKDIGWRDDDRRTRLMKKKDPDVT